MKNILELIKKYKVYLLTLLVVIFFFRSCSRSVKINKQQKELNKYSDSLDVIRINSFNDGFNVGVDKEKELILDFMDDELRSPQNLSVRVKFQELHNSIDVNKHRN